MPNALAKLLPILCCALALSGCASYFERSAQKHCFQGDWLAQGFDAGKRGKNFNEEWQAEDQRCADYNLWSNKRDFQQGYSLGKSAFCQIDNGFEFGLRNKRYQAICEPSLQKAFDRAYHDGQRLYQARRDIDYYESELDRTLDLIDYATYRRRELAEEIDSGKLDDATKRHYVKERYKLKKRREHAVYNLPNCRAQLRTVEKKASSLAYELSEYYDVDGEESSQNFSINQQIRSENRVVAEPSIIVYTPAKAHDKTVKQQLKEVSLLTQYVRDNHSRAFRYQVLQTGMLSFVSPKGEETKLDLQQIYEHRPKVLFWGPQAGLTAHSVTAAADLIPLVRTFIQRNMDHQAQSTNVMNVHKLKMN